MARATQGMHEAFGYDPPWISYYAVVGDEIVGGGAFVGSPADGRVEIAYFTLPEHQGKGYATRTAFELVQLVRLQDAKLRVWAKTLPDEGPSTHVLSKLGFLRTDVVDDHEIGPAWAWELSL